MVLSPSIYARTRALLLQCAEFQDEQLLQAIFSVEPLAIFQDGLPSAANKATRVDLYLSYLAKQRLSSGQALLPLFIAALRDRYPTGNALHGELAALHDALLEPQAVPPPSGSADAEASSDREWNSGAIRQLLAAALSDSELTTLCFDAFYDVYNDFGSGLNRSDKIQRLLEYCTRRGQQARLVEEVRKVNPTQYARFESSLKRH